MALNQFVDRVVEHPGRYTLTDTGGSVLGTYDLSRNEGTITEAGTPLNAANMNLVVDEVNDINDRLDAFLHVETYSEVSSSTPITPGDNTYYIDFNTTPKGYTAVGIVGVNTSGTGSASLRLRGFFLGTGRAGIKLRSEASSNLTAITITVDVLYVREGGI